MHQGTSAVGGAQLDAGAQRCQYSRPIILSSCLARRMRRAIRVAHIGMRRLPVGHRGDAHRAYALAIAVLALALPDAVALAHLFGHGIGR